MSGSEHGGNSNDLRGMSSPDVTTGMRSASPAKRSAADMEDVGGEVGQRREQAPQSQQQHEHVPGSFPTTQEAEHSDLDEAMEGMTPAVSTEEVEMASVEGTLDSNESDQRLPTSNVNGLRDHTAYTTAQLDEQVAKVTEACQATPDVGEKGIVVSTRWLHRVLSRTTDGLRSNKYSKESREGPIGPVDNSDIVPQGAFEAQPLADPENLNDSKASFIPLRPGLQIEQDIQVLPNSVWGDVVGLYGIARGQRQINRYAKNTAGPDAVSQNIQYELYPPTFTIRKIPQPVSAQDEQTEVVSSAKTSTEALAKKTEMRRRGQQSPDDAPRLVSSRSARMQSFLARAKEAAGIPRKSKVRVFRMLNPQNVAIDAPNNHEAGILSPPASQDDASSKPTRTSDAKLVLSQVDFKAMELGRDLEHVDVKDQTMDEKYNGTSTLDTFALTEDMTLLLEEQIGGPAGGEFQSDSKKPTARFPLLGSKSGSRPSSQPGSGRASPQPGGMMTRGRARRDGRTRGTVGLSNLGNTCYMNSALQCIRSVEELAIYFLSEKYKEEINMNNPLGYKGAMAKQYAGVLNAIYGDSTSSSFSPSNFKRTLGNMMPTFSGYGQQDSQEFLSFLVDALHEDLNRIQKKPYNENPDSDDKTVHDPQAIIELGEIYRRNHRARNDSVCMDLFSGFYKNTMECPTCEKVSITFDPYSLLTVQLPIENTFQHTVTLFPMNGPPINHAVDMDKNASIGSLKDSIAAKHPSMSGDRLWLLETYNHKIFRLFDDRHSLGEANIQSHDHIFAYELPAVPTNIPESRKKQSFNIRGADPVPDMDDPKADRMAVAVFSRRRNRFGSGWDLIMHPLYILLTREEAKDFEIILKKLLVTVAHQTSRKILMEVDEDSKTTTEPTVNGESEKEESAGEDSAPVSDRSVPSEDGYVEVSLGKPEGKPSTLATSGASDDVVVPPRFMDPEYPISDALRNFLFAVNYAECSDGLHFTSMTNFRDNSVRNMYSRVKEPSRRGSMQSSSEESATSATTPPSDGETEEDDADGSNADEDQPDIVIGAEDPLHYETPTSAHPDEDDELPEDPLQGSRQGRHRRGQGKKNKFSRNRKQKTYAPKERKANRKRPENSRTQNSEQAQHFVNGGMSDDDTNPYYIKLGECIVLDWHPDGYDALFGGDPKIDDDMRGHWLSSVDGSKVGYISDPELEEKKQKRADRRKHGVTLEDCFVETGKREILSEDNAWYCNRCKEMRQAAKTLEIWTIPDILIVHLKRFGGNRSFRDKIDVLVDYPIEGLDMTGKVGLKEAGKEYIYDLFAVDNHFGGLGGGHYTAFAKNFYDGHWYDYNDSMCSKISESRVHSAAAYLLFYRRRSDNPLGPPYLQNLVLEARNPQSIETATDDEDDESGEGKLGGPIITSSLHGSSSALVAAGAGTKAASLSRAVPAGGGVLGATAALVRAGSSPTTRTSPPAAAISGGLTASSSSSPPADRLYGEQGSEWGFGALGSLDGADDEDPAAAETLLHQTGNSFDQDGGDDADSTVAEMDSGVGDVEDVDSFMSFRPEGEYDDLAGGDSSALPSTPMDSIELEHPYDHPDHDLYTTAPEDRPDSLYLEDAGMVGDSDHTKSPPPHDIILDKQESAMDEDSNSAHHKQD